MHKTYIDSSAKTFSASVAEDLYLAKRSWKAFWLLKNFIAAWIKCKCFKKGTSLAFYFCHVHSSQMYWVTASELIRSPNQRWKKHCKWLSLKIVFKQIIYSPLHPSPAPSHAPLLRFSLGWKDTNIWWKPKYLSFPPNPNHWGQNFIKITIWKENMLRSKTYAIDVFKSQTGHFQSPTEFLKF